jgi:hypothetical protein
VSATDGRIIGPRTRIGRPAGGSAVCNASRVRDQPRSFSRPTPPPTTPSTSNPISSHLTSSHHVLRTATMSTWREVVAAARKSLWLRPLALFARQCDDAFRPSKRARNPPKRPILGECDSVSPGHCTFGLRSSCERAELRLAFVTRMAPVSTLADTGSPFEAARAVLTPS